MLTGKHPLAMGGNSATLTGRSVFLGGTGLAGGIITSSYVYDRISVYHTIDGKDEPTSMYSRFVPSGGANFPPWERGMNLFPVAV